MSRAAAAIAFATVLASCSSPSAPPCERSLEGIWRTGERVDGEDVGWHFLDRNGAIEGYPTYRDVPAELPPGVRAAPSSIDLVRRDGVVIGGRILRRYELGGQRCTIAATVHVTACAGDSLVLELGALAAPIDWSACGKPLAAAALATAPLTAPTTLRLHR